MKRTVEGDASETGLVRFIQPLLMDGDYGCWKMGGLEKFREKFPEVKTPKNEVVQVPFSSLIKFNAVVRYHKLNHGLS